jgi:hypothetical protein
MSDWKVIHEFLYQKILKLKQKELLLKSKFITHYKIPKNEDLYMKQFFQPMDGKHAVNEFHLKKLICDDLANHIYENKRIIKKDEGEFVRYELELLVLNMGELKHIVDYIIKSISQEDIDKIKNSPS